MQKQDMSDIVADVVMKEDDIKVSKAELKAFGGSVSASGTEMKLAHPHEPFHVVTKLSGWRPQTCSRWPRRRRFSLASSTATSISRAAVRG